MNATDIKVGQLGIRYLVDGSATAGFGVPRFAQPYMLAVLQHPFMQDWIAAAQEEDWVIEQFEKPASG